MGFDSFLGKVRCTIFDYLFVCDCAVVIFVVSVSSVETAVDYGLATPYSLGGRRDGLLFTRHVAGVPWSGECDASSGYAGVVLPHIGGV